jgi:hypothetical protein
MSSCAVGDKGVKIQVGSPEYLALKLSSGLLNYDEEIKKLDIERQAEVEEARKKLVQAGYLDGFKVTPKGEKALQFLEECRISG